MNSEQHPDNARLHDLLIHELRDFAVFLVGLDGRIRSWNPGVERLFGYSEAEFTGRDVSDLFTPEDRAAAAPQEEMNGARREGRASDMRWHLRKDQSRIFVEGVLIAIKDEAGALVNFAKIARAVHPRHVFGTLLETVLDETADAIYAMDKTGRYVFVNSQFARLLDRSIEEVVGRTREEVLPAASAANVRATDESIMQGNLARMVEERLSSHESGERVFLSSKAPWRDDAGKTVGLVSISQDITARKAFEQERERLLREVRLSNEELAAFSHVVAHDLQTPLRMVTSYTQLLVKHLEGRLDETARQAMTFVTDGTAGMERLIAALLHYAETGEELALRRVKVNAVVDGLLRSIEPLVQETAAEVTRDALPEVQADPVLLLQLFQNLVVNAIHYRDSGPPRVHISAQNSEGEYRFAIADNGIGIPRAHLMDVFTPLRRLHIKDTPGSGIGLAVCQKIVERHGGRIWVESDASVRKGSTFFFTLPVNPEKTRRTV